MGLRFHPSLKLIPGLRLNISKSGPSLSVGRPGMTETIGLKRTRTTLGLPGSGLSYSTSRSWRRKAAADDAPVAPARGRGGSIVWALVAAAICYAVAHLF